MGFPATLPSKTVIDVLVAAGIGLLIAPTAGANLFDGPKRPPTPPSVPHAAAFVVAYGGSVIPYMGAATKLDNRDYDVQVWYRGDVAGYTAGLVVVNAIMAATNRITTGLPTGYYDLRSRQSVPTFLGVDATEHPEWSINLLLRFEG